MQVRAGKAGLKSMMPLAQLHWHEWAWCSPVQTVASLGIMRMFSVTDMHSLNRAAVHCNGMHCIGMHCIVLRAERHCMVLPVLCIMVDVVVQRP